MVDAELALEAVDGDLLLGHLCDRGVADQGIDAWDGPEDFRGRLPHGIEHGEVHAHE